MNIVMQLLLKSAFQGTISSPIMSKEPDKIEGADDAMLVQRAQHGDMEALNTLLVEHQDFVYRTAIGYFRGDEDAAIEVAQDVFVAAFKNITSFRGESKLTTWLYRMTINHAKNYQVSQGRRQARFIPMEIKRRDSSGEILRPEMVEKSNPRDTMSDTMAMDSLMETIHSLDEEFRDVMLLRFVEQKKEKEIADILGIAQGTVKSRISRGRKMLRKAMKELLEERGLGSS